jgi:hypothetical protein
VEDTENALTSTYDPATLTAVLVDADGSVAEVVSDRGGGFQLTSALRSLARGGTQGLPQPGGTVTASVAAGPAGG